VRESRFCIFYSTTEKNDKNFLSGENRTMAEKLKRDPEKRKRRQDSIDRFLAKKKRVFLLSFFLSFVLKKFLRFLVHKSQSIDWCAAKLS
jgi:hypothetical protein